MMNRICLEIVCCSVDDGLAAQAGGADRIELCSALGQGGLTPSMGLLKEFKARVKLPVICMVRPRSGGFCYTKTEFDVMMRDADALLEAGADGLVLGVLDEYGRYDEPRNRRLIELAAGKPVVSHRCYDVVPEWRSGLDAAIQCGFARILTSGRANAAADAIPLLEQITWAAHEQIEIMPGGGIRSADVPYIVSALKCQNIHLAPYRRESDTSCEANLDINFAGSLAPQEGFFDVTDQDEVASVRAQLDSFDR